MEKNDDYKLKTRRYLAWGLCSVIVLALTFVILWSIMFCEGCKELASAAVGGLIATLSSIIVFYFGKKIKEE